MDSRPFTLIRTRSWRARCKDVLTEALAALAALAIVAGVAWKALDICLQGSCL
ncbi:MAG: hypothetical protein ACRCV9_09105 [Burkholderiaceae bacterium]